MSDKNHLQISVSFDRRLFDKHALSVVEKLQKNGFQAYFVGGCVRDLLLGAIPKDFDVLTNARPQSILKLFRNAQMIGKRFPIVHVSFGRHFIETTSWVAKRDPLWRRLFSSTIKSSVLEDARRRDFTVNALYYDPVAKVLLDPLDGMRDIKNKELRMIGPVMERMKEDPVRMLRALRLAGKMNFRIESDLQKKLCLLGPYLQDESDQRIYLEWVKMVMSGSALNSFELINDSDCLGILLPSLQQLFKDHMRRKIGLNLIRRALHAIDDRMRLNKTVSLVFALSVFFWMPVEQMLRDKRLKSNEEAVSKVLLSVAYPIRIPIKIREGISEIYVIQTAMKHRSSEHVLALVKHPRFRASFDFLMLRASVDYRVTDLAAWWHDYFYGDDWLKASMLYDQDKYHSERPRDKDRAGGRSVAKGKRR